MSNIFDFVKNRTRPPYLTSEDVTEALKKHTTAAVRRDVLAVIAGQTGVMIQDNGSGARVRAIALIAYRGNDKKKRSADAAN